MSGGGMGQFEPFISSVMRAGQTPQPNNRVTNVTPSTTTTSPYPQMPQYGGYGSPFGGGYGSPFGGGYGSPFGSPYGSPFGSGYGSPFGSPFGGQQYNAYAPGFGQQNHAPSPTDSINQSTQQNPKIAAMGDPYALVPGRGGGLMPAHLAAMSKGGPSTALDPATDTYNATGGQTMQAANAAGGQLMQQQRERRNQRSFASIQELEGMRKQITDLQAQLQSQQQYS